MLKNICKNNINLLNYNEKEIEQFRNGKVQIAYNKQDIRIFIKNSKQVRNNAKLYYGKLNKKVSDKIKRKFGIKVKNYNISLKSDSVKHIIKKHGSSKELLRGQLPIIDSDFELIPEIVSNYDNIILGTPTLSNKPAITFIKHIDCYYYLVSYVSDKSHNLEVQTMWKTKKNSATTNNALKKPGSNARSE